MGAGQTSVVGDLHIYSTTDRHWTTPILDRVDTTSRFTKISQKFVKNKGEIDFDRGGHTMAFIAGKLVVFGGGKMVHSKKNGTVEYDTNTALVLGPKYTAKDGSESKVEESKESMAPKRRGSFSDLRMKFYQSESESKESSSSSRRNFTSSMDYDGLALSQSRWTASKLEIAGVPPSVRGGHTFSLILNNERPYGLVFGGRQLSESIEYGGMSHLGRTDVHLLGLSYAFDRLARFK